MSNSIQLHVEGARRYSFNDRETGKLIQGVNVFYLQHENSDDVVGRIPAKVVLPLSAWDKVSKIPFPSICDATLTQTLTAKGVKTNVTDLNFVKKV